MFLFKKPDSLVTRGFHKIKKVHKRHALKRNNNYTSDEEFDYDEEDDMVSNLPYYVLSRAPPLQQCF